MRPIDRDEVTELVSKIFDLAARIAHAARD